MSFNSIVRSIQFSSIKQSDQQTLYGTPADEIPGDEQLEN